MATAGSPICRPWVAVTACDAKAPVLGSGSMAGKGVSTKMDLVVVFFVICVIAWLRKGLGVGNCTLAVHGPCELVMITGRWPWSSGTRPRHAAAVCRPCHKWAGTGWMLGPWPATATVRS